MAHQTCTIGVDLGGTKIKVALVDNQGRLQQTTKLATRSDGGEEAVVQEIGKAVRELRDGEQSAPLGVGVGVAGQIGPQGDRVRLAPNLGWHDVPLQERLEQTLKLPVVLLNDVRAATLAEWRYGAGRHCDDLVCLFVGTGVGGGVVSGGRLLVGSSNTAGELGHMTIDLHGPPCHCDNRGCLEALAGGWAIARRAQQAVDADPAAGAALRKLAAHEDEVISAELVARAAHDGDPLATRIVAETAEALIAGTVGLVNAFNPRRLILGGGVMEGLPELVEQIARGIEARALQAAWEELEVLPAELQNNAGVIGAAAFARRRQEKGETP